MARCDSANIQARSEHRLTQVVGGWRCACPRGPVWIKRDGGRDGLSVCVDRPGLGFPGCMVRGRGNNARTRAWFLRDGEHPLQSFVPGGVPCANRRRGGVRASRRGGTETGRCKVDHDHHAGVSAQDHRQDRPAEQPGRPRSLYPVHDGSRPAQGVVDGRRL